MFQLHPRLQADTVSVGQFPLCQLLLMNDANYPWFVLVPRQADLTEIHQLAEDDRYRLIAESCELSQALERAFSPDKLNIAALGNMVPQLHVHHVARYRTDPAWPGPIWGVVPQVSYESVPLQQRLEQIKRALAGSGFTPDA